MRQDNLEPGKIKENKTTKEVKKTMESGLKKTGISAVAVGIGGAMTALGSGVFTLEEALLLITAISMTANTLFNYYEG